MDIVSVSSEVYEVFLSSLSDQYYVHYELTPEDLKIYLVLYKDVQYEHLKWVFATLHSRLTVLFEIMNDRLDTGHYLANDSRELLHVIGEIDRLQSKLRGTQYAFEVIPEYSTVLKRCKEFLKNSGGSSIPTDFEPIDILDLKPVFKMWTSVAVRRANGQSLFPSKVIGGGSYATVLKYKDEYYDKMFAIKRALKNLTDEEYRRFKTEFETMKRLRSPYVLEVYNFDDVDRQYVMEFADYSLKEFISKSNTKLTVSDRVGIVRQILRAVSYIHSKGVLHRDISTTNVLVKVYDGLPVIKVADFGLVKVPDSDLTRSETTVKGSLNDPKLSIIGFKNYDMRHETFALTKLVYFAMTGRASLEGIRNELLRDFVHKGLADNIDERYQSVEELQDAFLQVVKST